MTQTFINGTGSHRIGVPVGPACVNLNFRLMEERMKTRESVIFSQNFGPSRPVLPPEIKAGRRPRPLCIQTRIKLKRRADGRVIECHYINRGEGWELTCERPPRTFG
jgi:hypothetical protein